MSKIEYIGNMKFILIENNSWKVMNKNVKIGYIVFDKKWRKFVFYPEPNTKYSMSCLLDLNIFIGQINKRR